MSLLTTRQGGGGCNPMYPPTWIPRPKGRNFQRFSQGPHLGLQTFACCLTTIYFTKQFYRLPALSFLFFSSTHPVHQLRLSLDKRVAGREQTESGAQRDLRNPPWLNSSSSRTGNRPREGKGYVQGMGSKVLGAEIPH